MKRQVANRVFLYSDFASRTLCVATPAEEAVFVSWDGQPAGYCTRLVYDDHAQRQEAREIKVVKDEWPIPALTDSADAFPWHLIRTVLGDDLADQIVDQRYLAQTRELLVEQLEELDHEHHQETDPEMQAIVWGRRQRTGVELEKFDRRWPELSPPPRQRPPRVSAKR